MCHLGWDGFPTCFLGISAVTDSFNTHTHTHQPLYTCIATHSLKGIVFSHLCYKALKTNPTSFGLAQNSAYCHSVFCVFWRLSCTFSIWAVLFFFFSVLLISMVRLPLVLRRSGYIFFAKKNSKGEPAGAQQEYFCFNNLSPRQKLC